MRNTLLASLAVLLLISCKPAPTASTGTNTPLTTTHSIKLIPLPPRRPPLDHFKFWQVKPSEPRRVRVALQGQFEQNPWKADVGEAAFIGNPVEKTVNGQPPTRINNPGLHYVAYNIIPVPGTKLATPPPVLITNQFERRVMWRLGDPKLLLVPADKSLEGATDKQQVGDHFVCYAALVHPPVKIAVTLSDEIDVKMRKTESLHDFLPKYLCVPTTKQRNDQEPEPVTDPKTHLALYQFEGMPYNHPAWTNDQFGRQQLNVLVSQLLGLPSEKEIAANP